MLQDFLIILISSAAGLVINSIRPDGLPLIAENDYETLVPCPEPIKDVPPIGPAILRAPDKKLLIIDARPESIYHLSHFLKAENLVFDYLEPVPDSIIKELIARKAEKIIVYGDGKRPDPGHELARELAGRGIRNVYYIDGGFAAIEKK